MLLIALFACTAAKGPDGSTTGGSDNPCGVDGGQADGGGSSDGGGSDGGGSDGGGSDGGSSDGGGSSWDLLITDVALAGSSEAHGTVADVAVAGGQIVAIGELSGDATQVTDGAGQWLAPAFIDSHTHLNYSPEAPAMARGGIAAAVDLAAPTSFFSAKPGSDQRGPLTIIASGPMVTAIGGYPTTSWGSAGYGVECADADEAAAAVDSLIDMGAGVIKIPVTTGPVLSDDAINAAVERAHERGVKVASHATSDAQAITAGTAGADVLAHTPTETLSDTALSLWGDRAVISTLSAFGGSGARTNLDALRSRGATILYGTDYGNTRTTGIDADELDELLAAGLSGAELLAAGTSVPATYWGLDGLGQLAVGKDASMLLLAQDPHVEPLGLADAATVWIQGVQQ